jgi:hypothetical protein
VAESEIFLFELIDESMDNRLAHQQLRWFWAGALTITTLCAQYSGVLMASQPAGKAFWSEQEVAALINHLHENRMQSEGVGNFKEQVWSSTVKSIAPFLARGPTKDSKMCRSKWNSVRCLFYFHYTTLTLFPDQAFIFCNRNLSRAFRNALG